jgi:hypothetical protein
MTVAGIGVKLASFSWTAIELFSQSAHFRERISHIRDLLELAGNYEPQNIEPGILNYEVPAVL